MIAPFELRVKRLSAKLSGSMGEQASPRTVTDMIRRDDTEKAGRMRYLFEVDVADPALYDIIVNTERVTTAGATEILVGLAARAEFATTPASRQLVSDRSLASRVQVALATNPETRKYRITGGRSWEDKLRIADHLIARERATHGG